MGRAGGEERERIAAVEDGDAFRAWVATKERAAAEAVAVAAAEGALALVWKVVVEPVENLGRAEDGKGV